MTRSIVVIDDDPVLLRLLEEIMAEEGYRVLLWSSSSGAFEYIRDHQPALVILDLRLERPDSGWALLQIIRMSTHTAAVPLLVCSADLPFLRTHAQQLAALHASVLEKPFAVDELLAHVQQFIGPAVER